jgi:hypothetical protein
MPSLALRVQEPDWDPCGIQHMNLVCAATVSAKPVALAAAAATDVAVADQEGSEDAEQPAESTGNGGGGLLGVNVVKHFPGATSRPEGAGAFFLNELAEGPEGVLASSTRDFRNKEYGGGANDRWAAFVTQPDDFPVLGFRDFWACGSVEREVWFRDTRADIPDNQKFVILHIHTSELDRSMIISNDEFNVLKAAMGAQRSREDALEAIGMMEERGMEQKDARAWAQNFKFISMKDLGVLQMNIRHCFAALRTDIDEGKHTDWCVGEVLDTAEGTLSNLGGREGSADIPTELERGERGKPVTDIAHEPSRCYYNQNKVFVAEKCKGKASDGMPIMRIPSWDKCLAYRAEQEFKEVYHKMFKDFINDVLNGMVEKEKREQEPDFVSGSFPTRRTQVERTQSDPLPLLPSPSFVSGSLSTGAKEEEDTGRSIHQLVKSMPDRWNEAEEVDEAKQGWRQNMMKNIDEMTITHLDENIDEVLKDFINEVLNEVVGSADDIMDGEKKGNGGRSGFVSRSLSTGADETRTKGKEEGDVLVIGVCEKVAHELAKWDFKLLSTEDRLAYPFVKYTKELAQHITCRINEQIALSILTPPLKNVTCHADAG